MKFILQSGKKGWFPSKNTEAFVEEKEPTKETPKEEPPSAQISFHRRTLRRSSSLSKVIAPLQRRASKILNKPLAQEEWKKIETDSIIRNRPRTSSQMEVFFTRRPKVSDLESKNILRCISFTILKLTCSLYRGR